MVIVEGGDISNETQGRFLFLFEGLIGVRPHPWSAVQESTYLRLHQWKAAVYTWAFNDLMLAHIYDITWRHHTRLDVAVFRPQGFVEALDDRFAKEGVPIGSLVSYESPGALARALVRRPDIMSVFFADPSMRFAFGGRGRQVTAGGTGFSPWV